MGRIRPVTETHPAYDYFIYKDGDYYRILNGKSLGIVNKFRDASTAINWALSLSDATKVLLGSGTFDIKSQITVPSYKVLSGLGYGTQLKLNGPNYGVVVEDYGCVRDLRVIGDLVTLNQADIQLKGWFSKAINCLTEKGADGIILDGVHSMASNCLAINNNGNGDKIGFLLRAAQGTFIGCKGYQNSTDFYINNADFLVVGCEAQGADSYPVGFLFAHFTYVGLCVGCVSCHHTDAEFALDGGHDYLIVGCQVNHSHGNAFRIRDCNNIVINGLTVWEQLSSTKAAFWIPYDADRIKITNCIIQSWTYGIKIDDSSCENIEIYNNRFRDVTYPITDVGSGTKIRNNEGFITENSGEVTIPAGSSYVDVTHGLDITPSLKNIVLTPLDDLGGRSIWVSDANSSTFRINLSSVDSIDHTIGWSYREW